MEPIKDTKGESWYSKLIANVSTMAEQLQLPGEMREAFREFVMGVARDQYCAGNKAGIRWLRVQMSKENAEGAAA